MDFDKIKPAVEEIELSEKQKEDIINACKKKKKRFNYKPLAATAAILIVTLAFYAANGTLFGAKEADMELNFAANESLADSVCDDEKAGSAAGNFYCYSSSYSLNGFRPAYYAIPSAFSSLVNGEEFGIWRNSVSAENGMLIAQFVEYFKISKEDFEKANSVYAAELEALYGEAPTVSPERGSEHLEIFNSDIVYSFDRTVIDGYYSVLQK